ncbi:hypothetical protein GDO78_011482 [Eleutherodactylus coqui]|uniref:Uncharacterized protein n=1 Tax=Eleutherodactylus coqui TaxID=57060 RepID=A0A8J6K5I7_ELECQ|nr:hypothetical protein GDO78_011482 [Eleutherodactylus coqui]
MYSPTLPKKVFALPSSGRLSSEHSAAGLVLQKRHQLASSYALNKRPPGARCRKFGVCKNFGGEGERGLNGAVLALFTSSRNAADFLRQNLQHFCKRHF